MRWRATLPVLLAALLAAPALADDEGPSELLLAAAEEITILGTAGEVSTLPGSGYRLDVEDLEEFQYDDVHRILKQVPGVYLREEDGWGLRPNIGIRGAASDRSSKVTLLEDGILLGPAPYSAPAAYYFPVTTRMTALEVLKGPAAIRTGPNTIGGAVNLVTRPVPDVAEGTIDVAGGPGALQQAPRDPGRDPVRGHVRGARPAPGGVHLGTDGFKDLDGGGDTGFDKNEAMGKVRYEWDLGTSRATTRLKLGWSDEVSNETYLGLSDADFARTPYRRYAASQRDRMAWDRRQFQVDQEVAFANGLDLAVSAYRHLFFRSWKRLDGFRDGPRLRDVLANPDGGQSAVFFAILRGDQDSVGGDQALVQTENARDFVSQGVQSTARFGLRPGGRREHRPAGPRARHPLPRRRDQPPPHPPRLRHAGRRDGARRPGPGDPDRQRRGGLGLGLPPPRRDPVGRSRPQPRGSGWSSSKRSSRTSGPARERATTRRPSFPGSGPSTA